MSDISFQRTQSSHFGAHILVQRPLFDKPKYQVVTASMDDEKLMLVDMNDGVPVSMRYRYNELRDGVLLGPLMSREYFEPLNPQKPRQAVVDFLATFPEMAPWLEQLQQDFGLTPVVEETKITEEFFEGIKPDPPGQPEKGHKYDGGKEAWHLLPWDAVKQVVKVLDYGAVKYKPHNWRVVSGWRWRYFNAAIRHLYAWLRGERLDSESNLPHLAHAACCVLFLLSQEMTAAPDDGHEDSEQRVGPA